MTLVLPWTRLTTKQVTFPFGPTNPDGTAVTGVECALLPYRSRGPSSTTTWVAGTFTPSSTAGQPGTGSITVAGPDAASPGASGLQLTGPGDVWARPVDGANVDPIFVARIDLQSDPS